MTNISDMIGKPVTLCAAKSSPNFIQNNEKNGNRI